MFKKSGIKDSSFRVGEALIITSFTKLFDYVLEKIKKKEALQDKLTAAEEKIKLLEKAIFELKDRVDAKKPASRGNNQ